MVQACCAVGDARRSLLSAPAVATQRPDVEMKAVPVGSMQGADRPECLSSLGDPHGSRWVPDWDGVSHVGLVLGMPSATSIEHGSGACRKGSGRCLKGVDVLCSVSVSEAEYPQRDRVAS